MNKVHQCIISYVREQSTEDPLFASFATLSDDQMARQMFSNYRQSKGLRLTPFGLEVMQRHFESYKIRLPDDEPVKATHLIFLDGHAKMPYFLSKGQVVLFDHELGIKLRLIDGKFSTLVEIED